MEDVATHTIQFESRGDVHATKEPHFSGLPMHRGSTFFESLFSNILRSVHESVMISRSFRSSEASPSSSYTVHCPLMGRESQAIALGSAATPPNSSVREWGHAFDSTQGHSASFAFTGLPLLVKSMTTCLGVLLLLVMLTTRGLDTRECMRFFGFGIKVWRPHKRFQISQGEESRQPD